MRIQIAGLVTLTLISAPLAAQAPSGGGANPIAQAVRDGWDGAKRNMLGSAKVMPDAKYGFKPIETVRSFGAILAHVAGANYVFCSAALGQKPPRTEDEFEKTAKTPAEIRKALEDSIAYCDKAYAALNDKTVAEMIDAPFGAGKEARVASLLGNTGHNNEHYGNLVTYLRINGLVPPSSAPSR